MDFTLALTYIIALGYLGLTVYLANHASLGHPTAVPINRLLYGAPIAVGLTALFAITAALQSAQFAALSETQRQQFEGIAVPDISAPALAAALTICVTLTTVMVVLIQSAETRHWLQMALFSRARATYDPASPVHTTALVFALLIASVWTVEFLLSGGTSALAETIETQGISASAPLFQAFLQIAFSFLGVGFAIRREFAPTLARLGLRWPRLADVRQALSTVALGMVIVFAFSLLQTIVLSPEQIEEQGRAAESIAASFATLPLALLLALSAAFGEEIFFRGALQPVFGLLPTTLFFTVLHSQVLLTPNIIVIFAIGILFGRLRQRQSTTAAILAHFLYNFTLLALSILVSSGGSV